MTDDLTRRRNIKNPPPPIDPNAAKLQAAETLASVLEPMLLVELAPKLTCTEANVLAEFVEVYRGVETAQRFLEAHAEGDDEVDDLHYLDADGKVHDRSDEGEA